MSRTHLEFVENGQKRSVPYAIPEPLSCRMTENDDRALRILAEQKGLIRPGYFGSLLSMDPHRKPQTYARPGGRALNRLKEAGFAEWFVERDDTVFGWQITKAGREYLARKAT